MDRPWPWRYGFATLCVVVAALARILLEPVMGDRQPFPTFYVALTLAAGYGGRGPVLLALGLGYLAASWFIVTPRFALAPEDPVSVGSYFCVGLAIAAFSDVMHTARDRERQAAARAIAKQAELEHEIAEKGRVEREREALFRQLETARVRLEAVLQQMPAGLIVAEAPSGRLALANAQVEQIWRHPVVPAEDYHDYGRYKGFDGEGRPYRAHQWPLTRSLAMGDIIKDQEIEFERGDGTRGTMSVSSAPIRDSGGTIIAAAVVFHDITDRKQAEEELRRAREELELRVAERTADLAAANEALRSEARERRQAEQARNELLRRLVDVQEEERGRIARELHDQMGQQLAALKLGLDGLVDGAADAGRRERLRRLLELTRQIGHDMHRIAWELNPAALEGYDLPTALASYAEEWSGHCRVPVQVQCSGAWEDRPSPRVEATVYRVVQEALTNVRKHARAGHVSLIVDRRDDHVRAIVEDDGVGFDAERATGPGRPGRRMGLVGMRQRAEAVGGEVQVESAPGGGTTVYVRVPSRGEAGDE